MNAVHDTLQFTRKVHQRVALVWDAYADVDLRCEWSVPAGEEITYEQSDFSVGGLDEYRCGPPGQMSSQGSHAYHVIEPLNRLVYADAVRRDGQLLAVALVTWELRGLERGTLVTVTDQVTSLVGKAMIDGHRAGHEKALDQLVRWLARRDPLDGQGDRR